MHRLNKWIKSCDFQIWYFATILSPFVRGVVKKKVFFTVRLTVRVDTLPPLTVRVLWFFQYKWTYFELFYHFIMEKLDQNFHICLRSGHNFFLNLTNNGFPYLHIVTNEEGVVHSWFTQNIGGICLLLYLQLQMQIQMKRMLCNSWTTQQCQHIWCVRFLLFSYISDTTK